MITKGTIRKARVENIANGKISVRTGNYAGTSAHDVAEFEISGNLPEIGRFISLSVQHERWTETCQDGDDQLQSYCSRHSVSKWHYVE
ncbi:MAG: hypothetical protein WC227_01060 [Patescibacteria group bacterium]